MASITVSDQPGFSMMLGPGQAAQILGIGVIADYDYIIHAMAVRPK